MSVPEQAAWFKKAKFGMFIHWGIYSGLGRGEQPLFRELLQPSEYSRLADCFKAERFDPDDWVATARAAEMKYLVLTTKHHDGFCLFDTVTTEYNAVKKGPRRDLVAKYVKACRKGGLRVGFYFSLADWNVPAYFSGPKRDPAGFVRFISLVHRQIEELVSNYGRIDLMWFDGQQYYTAEEWQSASLARMIRSHQPDIVINDRLPKPDGGGDWGYKTPEQEIGNPSDQTWESCITSTHKFWGYHTCHEDESMWYTQRELLEFFVKTVSGNGNLLLNVGPYSDGRLPSLFKSRTKFLGDWIRKNRAAIHQTRGVPFEFTYGGCLTGKKNRLYLLFLYWPGREFSLPGFKQKLKEARFLVNGKKIAYIQEPHRIIFKGMPKRAPDVCAVVELVFDGVPESADWAKKHLWIGDLEGLDKWAVL